MHVPSLCIYECPIACLCVHVNLNQDWQLGTLIDQQYTRSNNYSEGDFDDGLEEMLISVLANVLCVCVRACMYMRVSL